MCRYWVPSMNQASMTCGILLDDLVQEGDDALNDGLVSRRDPRQLGRRPELVEEPDLVLGIGRPVRGSDALATKDPT